MPSTPAPVSNPGSGSARTDGGPGNARQPLRDIPAATTHRQPPGAQAQLRALQGSGLPDARAGGGAASSGSPPIPSGPDVFGPTTRPSEPLTAGAPFGPGPGPDAASLPITPEAIVMAMYQAFPHPDLLRILGR